MEKDSVKREETRNAIENGDVDQKEIDSMLNTDDELDPRNFLRNLYANDNYQKLKENTEKEIVSHAKLEVENKHFLGEMDSFMTDLE